MKHILYLIILFQLFLAKSQETINDTITFDSLRRSFILYVPANYNSNTPTPLVFNFHGWTSNANEQMFYGDFRKIADTAGFIIVHPLGTPDTAGLNYWNANWGGEVDDIGFTKAMIDSISEDYSINLDRVYSTGMSNGGFMSFTLACEISEHFAAIASVTGSMNYNTISTCSPQHPIPVLQIHGTKDAIVPYSESLYMPINSILNYWIEHNNCDSIPTKTLISNINETDNSTAEHYKYSNGDNDVSVEHYKIINGAHTWPGAPIAFGTTNYDIDASEKIWQFFSKYDINGLINPSSIVELKTREKKNLVAVVNILGRKTDPTIKNMVLFFIYNDGSVEKKINL